MKGIERIIRQFLIVTSFQEGKYAHLVLHEIKKRISLGQEKYNRVAAIFAITATGLDLPENLK
jgi:hypothetical protein